MNSETDKCPYMAGGSAKCPFFLQDSDKCPMIKEFKEKCPYYEKAKKVAHCPAKGCPELKKHLESNE